MGDDTTDHPDDDTTRPAAEDELGALVDDAMKDEIKRQRARFVQQIMGLDRIEGVGRSDEHRNDDVYRDLDRDEREG